MSGAARGYLHTLLRLSAAGIATFEEKPLRYSKLPVVPWNPLSACFASHFMTRVPL